MSTISAQIICVCDITAQIVPASVPILCFYKFVCPLIIEICIEMEVVIHTPFANV